MFGRKKKPGLPTVGREIVCQVPSAQHTLVVRRCGKCRQMFATDRNTMANEGDCPNCYRRQVDELRNQIRRAEGEKLTISGELRSAKRRLSAKGYTQCPGCNLEFKATAFKKTKTKKKKAKAKAKKRKR